MPILRTSLISQKCREVGSYFLLLFVASHLWAQQQSLASIPAQKMGSASGVHLSSARCDQGLRSNRIQFYWVNDVVVTPLTKKNSGEASKDTSWKKLVKEAALVGGLLAGGEGSVEETGASTRNQIPNARNGSRNTEGVTPVLEQKARRNIKTKFTAEVVLETHQELQATEDVFINKQKNLKSESSSYQGNKAHFWKSEIQKNIYETCLLEVAEMTLDGRMAAERKLETKNQISMAVHDQDAKNAVTKGSPEKVKQESEKSSSIAEIPVIKKIETPVLPPVLSDDIAEEIGRKLLGKEIIKKETQEASASPEDEARWDAREKADQLSKQLAVARSHMKRWQKKYASLENSSALVSLETRSRADSTASVESALGSIDDLEEGKVEENIDPEVAAEQKRERLHEEIVRLERERNAEEEKWNEAVDAAEFKEANPQTKVKRWMEQDRAAIEKRATKKRELEMKEYCAANAERWMVCAEIEKIKKEANTAALSNSALLADLRTHEATAKQRWSALASQEKSVVEARNKKTISEQEALQEVQKKDQVIYQLWVSMLRPTEEGLRFMAKAGTESVKKEILQEDYFKEVEVIQNLAKEAAATKQYAKAIKQEALQQALVAVLEGNESSAKSAWHERLVKSAVAAREATLLAQRAPHPDWKIDEPRRTAQRTINSAKANKAAFDAFHQELERFNGIKMVWMARLEEAARGYAEGDATAWNQLTEEERSVYNTLTVARDKEKSEAIQKEIEEAEKEAEKARRQVGAAWISSTKAAREEIAKKSEGELERMKATEAGRQETIRWTKLTPEERILNLNEGKPKRERPEVELWERPGVEFLTIRNLDLGEAFIIGESDADFDFHSLGFVNDDYNSR